MVDTEFKGEKKSSHFMTVLPVCKWENMENLEVWLELTKSMLRRLSSRITSLLLLKFMNGLLMLRMLLRILKE
jgi:radical SAM superfamily enzyme YgiQ (UPF0313 family)